MRVDLMWWRAWDTWVGFGIGGVFVLMLAADIGLGWFMSAMAGMYVAAAGWVVYRTTLTVEADHYGVSFRRWPGPVHRYPWCDIVAVNVKEKICVSWGETWPREYKRYYCVLVLEGRPAVRIDAGDVRGSRRDAELVKDHIDQVRQRWDQRHSQRRSSPLA